MPIIVYQISRYTKEAAESVRVFREGNIAKTRANRLTDVNFKGIENDVSYGSIYLNSHPHSREQIWQLS
ncbi:MAG: hypothetical protein M1290_01830 [Candidatus Thermoplasmatota archaeon]|jgi:hypothetical protein|nr:hypothetical protein [Candidatus Thermoplasmatota archaeon]